MTNEEILKGNKLIENFSEDKWNLSDNYIWQNHGAYNESFDRLIPVVHKILFKTKLNDEASGKILAIQRALGNCEIAGLFEEVVEFIEFYNSKGSYIEVLVCVGSVKAIEVDSWGECIHDGKTLEIENSCEMKDKCMCVNKEGCHVNGEGCVNLLFTSGKHYKAKLLANGKIEIINQL